MDHETFALYLQSCLGDLFEAKGDRMVEVPYKVCVATLSLLQHLVQDMPGVLPSEIQRASIEINNALSVCIPDDWLRSG